MSISIVPIYSSGGGSVGLTAESLQPLIDNNTIIIQDGQLKVNPYGFLANIIDNHTIIIEDGKIKVANQGGNNVGSSSNVFVYEVNPTINDVNFAKGDLWVNSKTGEVFVYMGKENYLNFGEWSGQKGTWVGHMPPADPFQDGSCQMLLRFDDNFEDDLGNFTIFDYGDRIWFDEGVRGRAVYGDDTRNSGMVTKEEVFLGYNWTISAWVKPLKFRNTYSDGMVFSVNGRSWDGWGLDIQITDNNSTFAVHTLWGINRSNNPPPPRFSAVLGNESKFYHVVVRSNNGLIETIVDGSQKTTGFQQPNENQSSTVALIGRYQNDIGVYGFYIALDNLRYFNRPLTDDEVLTLYNIEKV